MTWKAMKLIDPQTGEMQCRVCGHTHHGKLEPGTGGKFYRGTWQCPHGCKKENYGKMKSEEVSA